MILLQVRRDDQEQISFNRPKINPCHCKAQQVRSVAASSDYDRKYGAFLARIAYCFTGSTSGWSYLENWRHSEFRAD